MAIFDQKQPILGSKWRFRPPLECVYHPQLPPNHDRWAKTDHLRLFSGHGGLGLVGPSPFLVKNHVFQQKQSKNRDFFWDEDEDEGENNFFDGFLRDDE